MLAPEGRKILIGLMVLTFIAGIFGFGYNLTVVKTLFYLSGVLFLFSVNFFRDPIRKVPDGNGIIVSPADGKVVLIQNVDDPDIGKGKQVSIFLNVFNVHTNRVPIDCTIEKKEYHRGKFKAAFDHTASNVNEQTEILMSYKSYMLKVKQIAGLIARRIHCYAVKGKSFSTGDRLGFIMFGSRTDLILPSYIKVKVSVGEKVKGAETIIGQFSE